MKELPITPAEFKVQHHDGRTKQPIPEPLAIQGRSKFIQHKSTAPTKVMETDSPAVVDLRFEDLFAILNPKQQVWLATRCTTETDLEASELLEIPIDSPGRWKKNRDFRFCYETLAQAGSTREHDLVAAIERSNAVRAVVEKQKLLMKPWEDCNQGERTSKTAMINDTIERILPKRRIVERKTTKSMRELIMDGHLEPDSLPDPAVRTQDSIITEEDDDTAEESANAE